MNIISTPRGSVDRTRPRQGSADLAKAGFTYAVLDLSLFCSPAELETQGRESQNSKPSLKPQQPKSSQISQHPPELPHAARPLYQQLQKAGIRTPIARAPYLKTDTKRQDLQELLLLLARESIRVCGEAGCGSILIEPLFSGVEKAREWTVNRDFYLSLAPLARDQQVKILLKNQCRDMGGHLIRGICSDPEEAASWIDKLNQEAGEERFAFCMDTGVCTLCGQNMQEFALALGQRIQAVLLRDLDGHRESSLLPFTCSGFERSGTDWLGLIRGLREIGFDGSLILDFSATAAGFSPLLRPQLLQLARAVGEYFQWQIEIEKNLKKYKSRVLFGAGNMCRNYMKCYGEKYPPLFTCDNNEKLWGTRFCGLEVKAPASLRELPPDCAVFICNIYYREIEAQLRDMGLLNPVEYFSDEFMSSFYFERLAAE